MKAIQDYYADDMATCYGCGRLNNEGLQLKTFWDGDETLSKFRPRKEHTAIPGLVYGGLLASLVDCHGTGSASLAYSKENNIQLENFNAPRFVTANLNVDYKKPTPIDSELEIRGKIVEITKRKVRVEVSISANSEICVTGEVTAILISENFNK